ncbi:MAG: flavodoxin family protein [Prevotella sp.]|jgi:flavodoxin
MKNKTNNKTLVVYFSYTIGNTKAIAIRIANALHADLEELQPVKPYSRDYDTVVEQGEREVQQGFLPPLKPLKVNVADYDRIIVGSPTWWYEPAPVVMSFLRQTNLKGKTVVPFMTNAGWPGNVIRSMTQAAQSSGASVVNSHEFRFSAASGKRDEMKTSQRELDLWIDSLK